MPPALSPWQGQGPPPGGLRRGEHRPEAKLRGAPRSPNGRSPRNATREGDDGGLAQARNGLGQPSGPS
eukprot:2255932-Alexandrium_andersonii.AAC.1